MSALVIAETTIRRDAEGRYCLNDLHRAAGGEKRHGPSYWLSNGQTTALIQEMATTGFPAVATSEGAGGGTYVAKELVYGYAMWISPAFHLRVIRAYDTLISQQQVALAVSPFYDQLPKSLPEALRLAAAEMEKSAALETKLAIAAPKAAALDMISAGEEDLTITQAAKVLGIKRETLTNWLHANGWVYRQNGSWVAYQQHIENGRLRYKEANYTDQKTEQACVRPYCHVTPKGLAKLAVVFGGTRQAA